VCDSAGPPPNQPDDNRFRQRDDPGGPLAFNRDEGHKTGQEEKNVSVDNTLNSRKPGLDELVPSRYALQVGDIEVLVISDGVLPIAGKTIAYNADSADLARRPVPATGRARVAAERGVVRSGDRTILVDAGLGLEFPDFQQAGRLALRLEAAGVDLASVTDVVLTHMHMDHIGGLLGDGLRGRLRPDLRVQRGGRRGRILGVARLLPYRHACGGAGRASVGRHTLPGRVPQRAAAIRDGVRGGAGGGRLRTGGHTPGHSVVRLASGDDRLTFAGDAVFQRATVVDITKAGRARVAKVLPGHIQVVRSLLFDALSDRDVHTLGDIMTRARDHMRARPPRSASPRRRHGPDAPTNQLASQDPLDE
jgi:glyoxylase-like metal-dependent hydrolase (beta-lactamase superfamily II)